MMRILALLLLVTILLSQRILADDSGQTSQRLDVTIRVEMGYLLYLPKDYDSMKSWPLVLFLHGSGERGDDLELVKKHGPPKLIGEGKEFSFIVVSGLQQVGKQGHAGVGGRRAKGKKYGY